MSKYLKYLLIILGLSNSIDFIVLLFNYSNNYEHRILSFEVSKITKLFFNLILATILLIPVLKEMITNKKQQNENKKE
jgi:preprotein translocase subunit SecY